ncbi:chromodomain-helicase-DNA-binding protein 2-like [Sceloporus undulatus]|uniref:chromodomain-helicase-DNA-binding protein 2-like n=1 Tax=Sceloporus undulatus TaxID=8520 RepID=UPI001C4B7256|nr:chromodomain-helicase-DNA-binding protein 2-like [Sceloporus undulatus]
MLLQAQANNRDSGIEMKRSLQKPAGSQSKTEAMHDAKRPDLQGTSQSIPQYTVDGFSDAELRRFVKSYVKFAVPLERLEFVARDAQLVDKSLADLKHLGELLHNSCASAIQGYEKQLKDNPPEDKGPGKTKGAFIKIGGVKVNAKVISQYEQEMEMLQRTIPTDPEERAKFCLTCQPKAANFDVEWGLEDDSHLLLGTYKHGYENWELIKSDPELKLTKKILPAETDKKPQGKQLQDRVDYLLDLVQKENKKKESVEEKKEEDGQDKSPAKKKQKKANQEDQEKQAAIKKKKDEKEGIKTKDKIEKPKDSKGKAGDKGNPWQGPVHVTARSKPIPMAGKEEEEEEEQEGNLNVATFDICKEWMRPVKKALHEFEKPGKELSVPEQMEHTHLLKIGDHIRKCLNFFSEEEDRALWRWNLWVFVSKFTESHARKLHRDYKMACRKRAKDEEDKKKKESEGVKKPVQPEPSGTSQVFGVPQIPPSPPQKVQQSPSPPPQMQGHQHDNYNDPNQRHSNGAAKRCIWQDQKYSYYRSGNRAWRCLRGDEYKQPWDYGDRQPHREPSRSWGNSSCKQQADQSNSDREHWGHRDSYNRYDQNSKRRPSDACPSQNNPQQDFRQVSDPRLSISYQSQGPLGHYHSCHPEKATGDKKMLPPPQCEVSGPSAPPAKKCCHEPLFVYRSPLAGLYKEPKSLGYNWNWKPRRPTSE